jgi:hypothetical protein
MVFAMTRQLADRMGLLHLMNNSTDRREWDPALGSFGTFQDRFLTEVEHGGLKEYIIDEEPSVYYFRLVEK